MTQRRSLTFKQEHLFHSQPLTPLLLHHFTLVESQSPSFCHHLTHKIGESAFWQNLLQHRHTRTGTHTQSPEVLDYYWVGGSVHFARGHFNRYHPEHFNLFDKSCRLRDSEVPFTGISLPFPVYLRAPLIAHETSPNH